MKNHFLITLAFLCFSFLNLSNVVAQEGAGDFFDDAPFDDGYDDNYFPNPPVDEGIPFQDPGDQPNIPQPKFNVPPTGSGGFNRSGGGFGGGGFGSNLEPGEIEFKLVDPPKNWKPRKKRYRPPSDFK